MMNLNFIKYLLLLLQPTLSSFKSWLFFNWLAFHPNMNTCLKILLETAQTAWQKSLNVVSKHFDSIRWAQQQRNMTRIQWPWQRNWNIQQTSCKPARFPSLIQQPSLKIDGWWQQRGKVQQQREGAGERRSRDAFPFKTSFQFPPPGGRTCQCTWLAFVRAWGYCRSTTGINSACVHIDFRQHCLPFKPHSAAPLTSSAQIALSNCLHEGCLIWLRKTEVLLQLYYLKNAKIKLDSCKH